MIKFSNLGSDDVSGPRTANLFFNIQLSLKVYPNRTLESNIGRVIMKVLAIKFEENEAY